MNLEKTHPYELPCGWAWTRLGQVGDVLSGYGFPKSLQGRTTGELPFFKVADISRAYVRRDKLLRTAMNYVSTQVCVELGGTPLRQGSIVFAKIGEAIKLNRRAILAQDSLVDNNVAGVHFALGVDNMFAFYFLSTIRLEEYSRATTVPSVRKSDLECILLPLPPHPEQHRIVAKIEELFTRLDAGVEALTKIKAQLKRYRQAVLKHAYEGKLTAEWRKAHQHELEPASVLLERIKQERQKNTKGRRKELAPLDTSGLTQLPAGWEWTVAGEITSVVSGGTPDTRDKLNFGGDVVWLTPADLSGWCQKHISRGARNITDRGLRSSSAVLLPKGAIVFSSRAPIGYVAIAATELCTNQGFKSFIPSDGVYNEYLYYYLKASTSLARSMASGTTFLELSASRAVGLPVPLPAISEQYRIVDEIERRFSVVEQIEKTVDQGLKQAERLRQSILKKAFEGKLVAQDPDDEPAEILLERIREERAKQLAQKRITVSRVKRKQSVEGH